jgi:putative ABC transport system substrate-binding protein
MKRREFITLLGGAAAACPGVVRAQRAAAVPVIGFLNTVSLNTHAERVAAFRQGLKEAGYVEGQNVHIAFRWAEGRYDRLPSLAAELVQNRVAVITTTGGLPSALAAKAATERIPIVFVASDPVRSGLVASLNRPGGNLTGVSPLSALLGAKRLGLLRELVPAAGVIAVIANPNYPDVIFELKDLDEAARILGLQLHVANASSERELEAAFASFVQRRADALLVTTDPFLEIRRDQILDLTARHSLPSMYSSRETAAAGGLMSYSPSFTDAYRQAGIYTGRVLKGDKPADLPVMQSTKFELVINRKTAKALGLEIPAQLLALAHEVIE